MESFQNNAKMKRILDWRHDEVTAVYHEKDLLNILLAMTHKLEEHMTGTSSHQNTQGSPKWNLHGFIICFFSVIVIVEEMVERQQVVIESMRLKDFMRVHQVDLLPTDDTGVVTYFQLNREIRNMAEDLYNFHDSHLFKMCWEKQAKHVAAEAKMANNAEHQQVANIMATPEKIHKLIFQPAYSDYEKLYELLKSGQIKLHLINELFDDFEGKYEGLAQELNIMSRIEKDTDKQWIHSRVQQIEQYHELHLAVASAEIIMMVKETLCLQGDFRVLETLREVVSILHF